MSTPIDVQETLSFYHEKSKEVGGACSNIFHQILSGVDERRDSYTVEVSEGGDTGME